MVVHSRKNRKAELLKSGLFSDICILVEDAKFPCHRFMLASASEFFEKMIQRDGLDTEEVRLEETTAEVFQIILNFIYTEDKEIFKNLHYTTLIKIVQNANMWLISEVDQICIDLLRVEAQEMNPELLIELYAVFYLLNNESFLKELIELLGKRIGKSMSDEISLKLFELSFDCLKDYVQRTEHIFSESDRFAIVEGWTQKNALQHNSTDEYVSILSTIDFRKMSIVDFKNGPGRSKLLADIDKYEILSELALKIFSDKMYIEKMYKEVIDHNH